MEISGSDSLEVPTIYKAYFCRPKFQGISPQNMARNMVPTYLHFRILKFPLRMILGIYDSMIGYGKPTYIIGYYIYVIVPYSQPIL